jgi:hypothetical protein
MKRPPIRPRLILTHVRADFRPVAEGAPMSPTLDSDILVFEDQEREGWRRVEYFDDDGGCYRHDLCGTEG